MKAAANWPEPLSHPSPVAVSAGAGHDMARHATGLRALDSQERAVLEKLNRLGISNEKFPKETIDLLLAAELIEAVPLRGYKITMKGQLQVTRQRMRVKYHQKEVNIGEQRFWPWLSNVFGQRSE